MSCVALWTAIKVEQLVNVMWKGTWESSRRPFYSLSKSDRDPAAMGQRRVT